MSSSKVEIQIDANGEDDYVTTAMEAYLEDDDISVQNLEFEYESESARDEITNYEEDIQYNTYLTYSFHDSN